MELSWRIPNIKWWPMARGEKVTFRFFLAKNGFFKLIPPPPRRNSPYDTAESADCSAEIILYRAVLDQAVHDLGSSNKTVREEAEYWFSPSNEDFLLVCELACLSHKHVYWAVRDNLDWIAKSKLPMVEILEKFNVKQPEQLVGKILTTGDHDV